MYGVIDLNELEKKAFRAAQQDGLWDIYIGGVVASMSLLAYSDSDDAFPMLRFSLFLVGLAASFLIYWAGKKYLTTPRLGQVKFGARRQKRKRTLVFVLSGIVLLQVALLAGTTFLWSNPQWVVNLGLVPTDPDRKRLLVAIIGALFVGPSTALIAYFNEFMRGYYIAFIISLAVFCLIWFGQPVYMLVAAALIIVPGAVVLFRFLRQYPLPPVQARHD